VVVARAAVPKRCAVQCPCLQPIELRHDVDGDTGDDLLVVLAGNLGVHSERRQVLVSGELDRRAREVFARRMHTLCSCSMTVALYSSWVRSYPRAQKCNSHMSSSSYSTFHPSAGLTQSSPILDDAVEPLS